MIVNADIIITMEKTG